jgi:hypothetical protein
VGILRVWRLLVVLRILLLLLVWVLILVAGPSIVVPTVGQALQRSGRVPPVFLHTVIGVALLAVLTPGLSMCRCVLPRTLSVDRPAP